MKRILWGLLLGAAVVGGCTDLPIPGISDPKKPPKYDATKVLRFADWYVEPGSCVLNGNSPEVKTTTNAHMEDNGIELRLVFAAPLAGRPRAAMSSYPIALNLEGQGQAFTLHLPYTPGSVAHYLQSDSFITIAYQSAAHDGEDMEVSFSTSGLVDGVNYLSRTCK